MKKQNLKTKIATALCSMYSTFYVLSSVAYASGTKATLKPKSYTVKEVDLGDMTGNVLSLVFMIVRIVGAVWGVMGAVKLIGSFKDDRPEDVKSGVASLVAGVMLVAAPSVLQFLGVLQ